MRLLLLLPGAVAAAATTAADAAAAVAAVVAAAAVLLLASFSSAHNVAGCSADPAPHSTKAKSCQTVWPAATSGDGLYRLQHVDQRNRREQCQQRAVSALPAPMAMPATTA